MEYMDDGLDIPMMMAQAQLMNGTNGNEAGLLMIKTTQYRKINATGISVNDE